MKNNEFINLTLGGQKWTPVFIAGINQQRCVACCACFSVCPAKVFVKTVKGTVEAIHRKRCLGCGVCAKICPEGAITCLEYAELEAEKLIPGSK